MPAMECPQIPKTCTESLEDPCRCDAFFKCSSGRTALKICNKGQGYDENIKKCGKKKKACDNAKPWSRCKMENFGISTGRVSLVTCRTFWSIGTKYYDDTPVEGGSNSTHLMSIWSSNQFSDYDDLMLVYLPIILTIICTVISFIVLVVCIFLWNECLWFKGRSEFTSEEETYDESFNENNNATSDMLLGLTTDELIPNSYIPNGPCPTRYQTITTVRPPSPAAYRRGRQHWVPPSYG